MSTVTLGHCLPATLPPSTPSLTPLHSVLWLQENRSALPHSGAEGGTLRPLGVLPERGPPARVGLAARTASVAWVTAPGTHESFCLHSSRLRAVHLPAPAEQGGRRRRCEAQQLALAGEPTPVYSLATCPAPFSSPRLSFHRGLYDADKNEDGWKL